MKHGILSEFGPMRFKAKYIKSLNCLKLFGFINAELISAKESRHYLLNLLIGPSKTTLLIPYCFFGIAKYQSLTLT